MAGKKKKGLANRLAKMTDEERARYLQRRADLDEEIRRRKEQLICIFMKNKLKREEAFSRLNQAKINQHWHKVLRSSKCDEMKNSCKEMKKWIERVLVLKDNRIEMLMGELQEAEFQYGNNLKAHLIHVEQLIEFHQNYVQQLQLVFENDKQLLLDIYYREEKCYNDITQDHMEYMKTLVYGQEVVGRAGIKQMHNSYLKRSQEYTKFYHSKLEALRHEKCVTETTIWMNIANIIEQYVQTTDKRRAQLAEMLRIDKENAVQVMDNQKCINRQEDLIRTLKKFETALVAERTGTLGELKASFAASNDEIQKIRLQLHKNLSLDNDKLIQLTSTSNSVIEVLNSLVKKGEYMLQVTQMCSKYETRREKICKWSASRQQQRSDESAYSSEGNVTEESVESKEVTGESSQESYECASEELQDNVDKEKAGINENLLKYLIKLKYRPKTKSGRKMFLGKKVREQLNLLSIESSKECKIKVHATNKKKDVKKLMHRNNSVSPLNDNSSIICGNVEMLSNLEEMWLKYGKVRVGYFELKEERKNLLQENENLKQSLRDLLENAVTRNVVGVDQTRGVRLIFTA